MSRSVNDKGEDISVGDTITYQGEPKYVKNELLVYIQSGSKYCARPEHLQIVSGILSLQKYRDTYRYLISCIRYPNTRNAM